MNTEAKKFNSEQVEFLDLFLKVDQRELDEYDDNLYYSLFQTTSDKPRLHMDWIKSSRSYDCIPDSFESDKDIYFGVNLAHTQPPKNRTNNQVIVRIAALYVDFDGKDLVDAKSDQYKEMVETHYNQDVALRREAGKNIDTSAYKGMRAKAEGDARESIFKANRQLYLDMLLPKIVENTKALPPSLIVFSGGGYHCYWLLDKAKYLLTPEDRAACIEAQMNFVLALDGDESATDIARVLRVLGTTNTKYQDNNIVTWVKKDVDVRYSFEQLANFANNSASAKAKRAKKSSTAGNQSKPNYMHGMPDLNRSKKAKVRELPEATVARLKELYPDPLGIFQHFGFFTSESELVDECAEWRIRHWGGLLVVKEGQEGYGAWYCWRDEYGGGVVKAWLWASEEIKLGADGNWTDDDHKLYISACIEMLMAKGLYLDANYEIIPTEEEIDALTEKYLSAENPRSVYKDDNILKDVEAMLVNSRVKRYSRTRPASRHFWDGTSDYSIEDLIRYEQDLDDVIRGFATRGEGTMLYGPGGTGKSYICLEMSIALILCRQVLGQLATTAKTGHVLYIGAETDPDFANRVEQILLRIKATPEQRKEVADKLHYIMGRVDPVHLTDREWAMSFAARILHKFEKAGILPDIIFLDTLRAATASGDIGENDNNGMGFVMQNAVLLGTALGNAAVIVVHHPNKEGKSFSGAGSLSTNINKVFVAEQLKEGMVIVKTEKNKLGKANHDEIFFAAQFVTSATGDGYLVQGDIDKAAKLAKESKGGKPLTVKNQLPYMRVIHRACEQGKLPKIGELSNLLIADVGEAESKRLGNNRKRTLESLKNRKFVEVDGDIDNDNTVIKSTQAGRNYMNNHTVKEENI